MQLTALGYLAAAGAAGAAGAINALAGGGTLVSFSTLVGLGVPPVTANVTNTVSLVPGYLSGAWAQRGDLGHQLHQARVLAIAALLGGLAGSVLLVTIPANAFRAVVPYLILLACALLLAQDWLKERLRPRKREAGNGAGPGTPAMATEAAAVGTDSAKPDKVAADVKPPLAPEPTQYGHPALLITVFAASVYGGFFGAGLGIMLMAVLGLLTTRPMLEVNALKQALSFLINLVAACFFAISGRVAWELVPVMAVAAIIGATLGTRLVRVIDPIYLRRLVVLVGVAVAVAFWVD
jgi:uncharacterized protein